MAKIKTVSVTYGRKHNLGNYNMLHIESAVEIAIEPKDDIEFILSGARELLRNHAVAEIARVWRNQKMREKAKELPLSPTWEENDEEE